MLTSGEAFTTCWLVVLRRMALGKPQSTFACCCCFADDIGTAISFIAENNHNTTEDVQKVPYNVIFFLCQGGCFTFLFFC